MSDSELSDAGPDDHVLEQELRQVVQSIYRAGNLDDLTIKRVRLAAEKNLRLEDGFYKSDAWKARSKDIIEKEVAEQDAAKAEIASKGKSPVRRPLSPKRKSSDTSKPSKRQKKAPEKAASKSKVDSSSDLSELDEVSATLAASKGGKGGKAPVEYSDSELSELIDEGPKPLKRRGKDSVPKKMKSKKAQKSKSTKAKAVDADPDAEEIKNLQGWLVKCGIRKVWGKELKPFESPTAKIKHLKGMLADVGMTGRYSIEKARRIRDLRELQADLEDVQEGARYWGKSDEEEERGARRKRLARGFQVRRKVIEDDDDDDNEVNEAATKQQSRGGDSTSMEDVDDGDDQEEHDSNDE